MAAIVWADVTNLVASLSAVPPAAQFEILTTVNAVVNAARLGGEDTRKTKVARVYLAAHMGELERRAAADAQGSFTQVAGKQLTADGFKLDFTSLTSDDSLAETTHGRAYMSWIKNSACAVGFVAR